MLCDNKCAVGIANDTIKAKRSKAMDMRYHWIRDRVKQNELTVEWCRGDSNLADFFYKAIARTGAQASKASGSALTI